MLTDYIKETWGRLLRNTLDVALDPKVSGGMRTFLYIPPSEDPARINLAIAERRKSTEHQGAIEVKVLPDNLEVLNDHGILYLPNDYIVPGGRFNEMYGWDSYWIILGLLHDGLPNLARGMVENCFYMVEQYGGKILNANRTYYLSRSQPPMLGPMMMAVLGYLAGEERAAFLARGAAAIAKEYEGFWKTERFNPELGLFHYGNIEQGALGLCPEVAFGERDEKGMGQYEKIASYLRDLPPNDPIRHRFFDEEQNTLTPEAIAGDRAMRESGFDASMHMGFYGMETLDYSPACLNSLLYVQCQLLAHMYKALGKSDRSHYFQNEAQTLSAHIRKYMWDEASGLFLNFYHRENRATDFPYVTCVYPLWAGIATPEQAKRFRDNLGQFETPFGLKGTDRVTGCQWDAPFMWAPLVYFTVAGLQNYGFTADARRIAQAFVDTVNRVYDEEKAIFDKYNADTGGHRTEGIVDVGYSENVLGFGWTNGTVLTMLDWLQATDAAKKQVPVRIGTPLWEGLAQAAA